jgi:hypothetical protein
MELLGDVGYMESCFSPFGDSVSDDAKYVHGLCQAYHRLRNRLTHPMVLPGDEAQVEAQLGLFGDSAVLEAR